MRRTIRATHASTPRSPVVTNDVGMKPMPEEKSTFQNTVELSDGSRYLSHSMPNVPGPEPKSGDSAYVFWAIEIVDCHEGRTDRTFTLSVFANAPPSVPPIMKNSEMARTASGIRR